MKRSYAEISLERVLFSLPANHCASPATDSKRACFTFVDSVPGHGAGQLMSTFVGLSAREYEGKPYGEPTRDSPELAHHVESCPVLGRVGCHTPAYISERRPA